MSVVDASWWAIRRHGADDWTFSTIKDIDKNGYIICKLVVE